MTITQLEYVVGVATYRSFVAAAEKCFVTQPTLSMQIQKLEDEMGVRLFDRSKHPIAVTEIGERIVEQARVVLAEAGRIGEIIQNHQNLLSGSFRIAVIPTVAPYLLPRLLEDFTSAHPEIQINASELPTGLALRALHNGEIDAAILSTPLEENNLKEYPLFYEPLLGYFAEGEPALSKRLVGPEDIELDRIWLLSEGNCMRNQVLDLCSDQIRKMQGRRPYQYESSNVDTLRKMVDRSGGLTVLPELSTHDFPEDLMERIRYFEEPQPVREISIVTADHFVRVSMLQSLMDAVLALVPEQMRVQKKNRKVLRIQSARL